MTRTGARSLSTTRAIVLAELLLLCFAAATAWSDSKRRPSFNMISYASAGGRSPECLRPDPPPFSCGVSAITITGEHTAAGDPDPLLRLRFDYF